MAEKDPQLETKKRARRRLVGATALALVAAVVLPMVMDAEPKPITEDIQIRIPNPDATAALSRPMPVKPAGPASAAPVADTKNAEAAPPVPIESDGGSVKPAADQPKSKKPEAQKVELPPVAAKTESKVETKPEVKADAKAEAKPEAKAETKPEPKPEPKAEPKVEPKPTKTGEQFVVQLGTFSDSDNARRVRTKAKGLGVETYSEPLKAADGSEKLRVRAGPFPSRAAAEAARAKLSEAGLAAVVTVKQ